MTIRHAVCDGVRLFATIWVSEVGWMPEMTYIDAPAIKEPDRAELNERRATKMRALWNRGQP